jgi:chaperonin cofactor prefoldin
MFRKSPTPSDPTMQTPDDCPVVQKLTAKAGELAAEILRLERQHSEVDAGIAAERSRAALDSRAAALLSGDSLPPSVTELHKQLGSVQEQLAVMRRARELVAKQLGEARAASSQRIAATRKPAYVEIVRKMQPPVEALLAVAAEEQAFRDQCRADDVQLSAVCRPMWIQTHPLHAWLRECKEHYGI